MFSVWPFLTNFCSHSFLRLIQAHNRFSYPSRHLTRSSRLSPYCKFLSSKVFSIQVPFLDYLTSSLRRHPQHSSVSPLRAHCLDVSIPAQLFCIMSECTPISLFLIVSRLVSLQHISNAFSIFSLSPSLRTFMYYTLLCVLVFIVPRNCKFPSTVITFVASLLCFDASSC